MGLILNKENKKNLFIYSAFILIVFVGSYYGHAISNQYTSLRVWEYQTILLLLLGIPFLFFQTKANLPNLWQSSVSVRKRLFIPAAIGTLFGILDIIVIKMILHPEPYTELPPFLQPFPYSIFLYFSGAFEVEIFYRLIPLTIILLLGKWFSNGKYFNVFFWVGAILTALREPLEQLPSERGVLLILYAFATGFLMNFLQAIYYKKLGFLASLSVRLGHYMFWHILLGVYVEYFELM